MAVIWDMAIVIVIVIRRYVHMHRKDKVPQKIKKKVLKSVCFFSICIQRQEFNRISWLYIRKKLFYGSASDKDFYLLTLGIFSTRSIYTSIYIYVYQQDNDNVTISKRINRIAVICVLSFIIKKTPIKLFSKLLKSSFFHNCFSL